MQEFSWIILTGGLAFFFFGLNYARGGLQLLAGDNMRLAIARMTRNRFSAFGLGTLITVMLQSSTATILMLISLAGTGLLTLTQAFGVILGADIGTTLVVVLLSIKKITDYALLMVVFGFGMEWFSKESKQVQYVGRILFGFGMVFYGMKLMTATASPLATDPAATTIIELLANNPTALLIATVILTVLVQTSAAVIGMAIALALAGVITLDTACPIVLGANVGTCFSPLLASLAGDVNGKRVAVAHLFVKVAGVVLAMPFIAEIARITEWLAAHLTRLLPMIKTGVAGNIAIVHLGFNLALAVLFLPLLSVGVWFVSKLVPADKKKKTFGPLYLDKSALDTPPLAFAQAKREILRISNLCYELYRDSLKMFNRKENFTKVVKGIQEKDDKIDFLDKAVRFYLAKLSSEKLTDNQSQQQMALLSITADLEGIGDVISKEMAALAQKKTEKGRIFSDEGWRDLNTIHQAGLENFSLTNSIITAPEEELVRKMVRQGEEFNRLEQRLRQSHIQRLHDGNPETFETSSIHLDVLGNLKRINSHLIHMAGLAPLT